MILSINFLNLLTDEQLVKGPQRSSQKVLLLQMKASRFSQPKWPAQSHGSQTRTKTAASVLNPAMGSLHDPVFIFTAPACEPSQSHQYSPSLPHSTGNLLRGMIMEKNKKHCSNRGGKQGWGKLPILTAKIAAISVIIIIIIIIITLNILYA